MLSSSLAMPTNTISTYDIQPIGKSFIYNAKGDGYRFNDPNIEQFSCLDSFRIGGHRIIFIFDRRYAIHYKGRLIYSIDRALKAIGYNQKSCHMSLHMIECVAKIVNYLSQGKEYQYIQNSAKLVDKRLCFDAKRETSLYKVSLSLEDGYSIYYCLNNNRQI